MTETSETRIIDWNEAWADRYGRRWPKVETLIKTSRLRWEFLDKNEEKGRQAQIDNERLLQEAAEKSEFIAKDSALLAQARANVAERARRSARLVSLAVSVGALILLGVAGFAFWEARKSIADQTRTLAALSRAATSEGRVLDGVELALAAWPRTSGVFERPILPEVLHSLSQALASGPPIAILRHAAPVNGALLSKSGGRVLSWSDDGAVRLWDIETCALIGAPMRHDGPVYGARFDKDERRVLSWSDDGTIALLDVATGKPIGELKKHGALS